MYPAGFTLRELRIELSPLQINSRDRAQSSEDMTKRKTTCTVPAMDQRTSGGTPTPLYPPTPYTCSAMLICAGRVPYNGLRNGIALFFERGQ